MRGSRRCVLIAIAIGCFSLMLRLAPTAESYWVDELHTAWTVSDSFMLVAERASDGHQQPLYFQLLWVWSRVFGTSEVMMRLTSVIAVSLGCVFLFLGMQRAYKVVWPGVFAGLLLAVESNSIFFGTELRPYAAVICLAAIACLLTARLWGQPPSLGRRGRDWVALWLSIGVAAAFQITSLGVLVWLPLLVMVRWSLVDWRATLKLQRSDAMLVVVGGLLAASLFTSGIQQTWQNRQLWSRFATAVSVSEIFSLWPWNATLIAPLTLLGFSSLTRCCGPRKQIEPGSDASLVWAFALVVVISTVLFWCVSYWHVAAIWHRRYLVACLPLIAWVFGAGTTQGVRGLLVLFGPRLRDSALLLVAVGLLTMVMSGQGTLAKAWRGQWLVYRGENWRDAIRFVNEAVASDGMIWLDPGLIETASLDSPRRLEQGEYLRFVVDGPYAVRRDLGVVLSNHRKWVEVTKEGGFPNLLLTRHPVSALARHVDEQVQLRNYGNVAVAHSPDVPTGAEK
ncbi:hypothetical protein Poly41_05210 [Novipirellula artificiosorum]|uniref:Uncharacterized protein n=2 Tax=Novipirellula artificiosorum TaxID=2528016 RepID=A0A5C6E0H8_9BACT|nr:hypothetical protein Poly41_05210 [Novipirellula artificiosorum]